MAYTNTDTNMTTSSGLSVGMQTYYNRELLRTFEPNLVHLQFGDEHRMPAAQRPGDEHAQADSAGDEHEGAQRGRSGRERDAGGNRGDGAAPAVRRIRAMHGPSWI